MSNLSSNLASWSSDKLFDRIKKKCLVFDKALNSVDQISFKVLSIYDYLIEVEVCKLKHIILFINYDIC